jgi:thioredoxin-related protein
MKTTSCVATVMLAGAFVLACLAGDDPTAKPKTPDAKKPIYDEKADAKADIKAALGVAKRENRRVLIQWGANWCSWCARLDERLRTDPGLRKTLLYEYVVVHVDINMGERNGGLSQHYKMVPSMPALTVLDATDKVLANQAAALLVTESEKGGKEYDSKQLLEFLNAHRAEPLKADAVLHAGLAEAARTERGVFLHFGAPWCGWCLKLEAWLAQPKITEIMGKDFVDVKIDQDRMTGAKEVFARYNAKGAGGIPWFAFLDGKGKVVAASDGPKGNIGFPYEVHEIDHFIAMLTTAKHRITGDEVDTLRRSLVPVKRVPAAK